MGAPRRGFLDDSDIDHEVDVIKPDASHPT